MLLTDICTILNFFQRAFLALFSFDTVVINSTVQSSSDAKSIGRLIFKIYFYLLIGKYGSLTCDYISEKYIRA